MRHAGSITMCLMTAAASLFVCDTTAARQDIDFVRDIRPILADNCYTCHGPDDGERVTDLRLDQREGAFSDLGGYRAVVPGDPDSSEMLYRVLSDDPDTVMPPPDHRKKLTEAQKTKLVRWIEEGAVWSEHWSFEPIEPVDTPSTTRDDWAVNDIDRFILARLEQMGLEPSPVAQRYELLRRLSLDLTGLPPTIEEIDAFLNDTRPDAYERVVDRLLASDHYGERMAVYWLDLVRYADTVGYHGDQPVSVSPYRDYVINAFNNNMRFDRFTREQLAGDLLDSPTTDQLVASGYNRLGMMSAEGGVQDEEYLAKYSSDRVRTTASVWLGVTLGCAECHDHKFDPFTTREFYEFAAFFADIEEKGLYSGSNSTGDWGPSVAVPDADLPDLLAPLDDELQELNEARVETPELVASRRAWEETLRSQRYDWQVLEPLEIQVGSDVNASILDDRSILISGSHPTQDSYIVVVDLPDSGTRAVRLEVLPDDSLPQRGPGRASNGNFVVSEFLILPGDLRERGDQLKQVFEKWPAELQELAAKLDHATATIEQTAGGDQHPDKKWSANSAIDRDAHGATWGWAILPEIGKPHELVIQIADGQELGGPVTIVMHQNHTNGGHTLGRFRVSASAAENAVADPLRLLPNEVREAIVVEEGDRSEAQQAVVRDHYAQIAPELEEVNRRIAELTQLRDQTVNEHTRTSLITVSRDPREIRVLPRGDWMNKSGDIVSPGVPFVLGEEEWQQRANRLDLANWIVDPDNPVTSRTFVNRIWRMFFGSGLSNVLDDLGSQGEPPTHPELLDRLAYDFVDSEWDVKKLVKAIVMSQTYRQSSRYREDLMQVDPENRYLARQSRFRVAAEFVRDVALSSSGLLNPTLGGNSVFPYQPPGLYRHLNFPTRTYQASDGPDQYRRGLYTHWQRQYLHPAMRIFDAPPREECTAARPRSSTPLGALLMLNDPSYVEAARCLAQRALTETDDQRERLDWIMRIALGRSIYEQEVEVLEVLLDKHLAEFRDEPEEAGRLIGIGLTPPLEDVDPATLAAWTSVCRAVMNMHEFILRK